MDKHRKFHIGIKALITDPQGQILLFQVNPAALKDNKYGIYWDIPGGRMEADDTIESTLKRELFEEAGIQADFHYSFFHATISNIQIPTNNGPIGLALFIYKVHIAPDTPIHLSTEHQAYQWFSPLEAAKLLAIKYPPDFTNLILKP